MGNSTAKQQKDRKKSTDNNAGVRAKRSERPACKDGAGVKRNSRGSEKKNEKYPRATNPFIIFYLRLRSKRPKEQARVIARIAGRLWSRMPAEERKKYVDLANAEKKRRAERAQKRKYARCGSKRRRR